MKILVICFLWSINLLAQSDPNLILTQGQNEKWFQKLEQLDLQKQIEFINKRILADTNIFIPDNLDRLTIENPDKRVTGFCKPAMLVGGILLYVENRTQSKYLRKLTSLLTVRTVVSIKIMDTNTAQALFGSRVTCEGLQINVKSK